MNKKSVNVELTVPYSKTYLLNKIYNYFEILKRQDNESDMQIYIKGNKNKINEIIAEIKK